ncbi:MATE family efflux transporter [Dyadobacter luticola]|uniref:MATE family efflux transporter n=1 Tax=Dyadobacter luticola TaxID=1979387 RepID=A0A5R9L166_9BACT|nr:MATE family efflux transporter [Dyadobacter luticola]TLV02148.1 hypothetical protein FEN17_00455 [Dyadobacter luticola]
MNASNPLSTAPIKSLFFKYYIPTLTSIASVLLHQVVNGLILSRQVGKEGIAAVGLYGSVLMVFTALNLPILIGGGILIGKNIGAGNYQKAQQVFRFATTIGLVLGFMAVLLAPFIVTPIARFLAGNENTEIIKSTSDYMFWQFMGLPFFCIRIFWGNFVANDNAPKASRNAAVLAVVINLLLDFLLIIVFPFGVTGASIATTLAIFGGALYLFFHIKKGQGHLTLNGFRLTIRLQEWRELLNLGLPSFASEIAFSTGLLVINRSVVPYGQSAVAAFGIINYMSFIFIRLFTSAMIASLTIISFNMGAKLPGRVLETLHFGLGFTLILGFVVTGVGFAIPDLLVSLFSGDEPEAFQREAGHALKIYFLLFLATGPNFILAAYFQSIGKSVVSILINISKGGVLIAFFAFLLPRWFGLDGIWLARGLAEIGTLLLVAMFSVLNWKKYYVETAI